MQWRQIRFGLVPAMLFFFAWVVLSSSHFAAWDVMEEVSSTTTQAQLIRSLLGPLGLLAVIGAAWAGMAASRTSIAASRNRLYRSLFGAGAVLLVATIATSGLADDRIYPLTAASVDVVPPHSVALLLSLVITPWLFVGAANRTTRRTEASNHPPPNRRPVTTTA